MAQTPAGPGQAPFSGGNYAQPPEPSVSANRYGVEYAGSGVQYGRGVAPDAVWSETLIDRLKTRGGGVWPVGLKINMDTALFMLDVEDTPLTGGVNSEGLGPIGSRPVDQSEFFWGSEQATVPRAFGTMGAAGAFVTSVTQASFFYVNDLVRFVKPDGTGGGLAMVTAKPTSTGLTLMAAGDTALPVSGTVLVQSLGLLAPEGSDPIFVSGGQLRDFFSNYTRIYGPYAIRMTRTEQQIAKMFTANEFNSHWARVTKLANIAREQDLIYGVKYYDTNTRLRLSGGMRYFIEALGVKVDAKALTGITKPIYGTDQGGDLAFAADGSGNSGNFDVFVMQYLQQQVYNRGGKITDFTANPIDLGGMAMQQRDLIRIDNPLGNSTRGYRRVLTVETEFGTVTMHRNRWINQGEGYAYNRSGVTQRVMQPMVSERLPKKGDYDEVMLVSEAGVQVKGAELMGMVTNIVQPKWLQADGWPAIPTAIAETHPTAIPAAMNIVWGAAKINPPNLPDKALLQEVSTNVSFPYPIQLGEGDAADFEYDPNAEDPSSVSQREMEAQRMQALEAGGTDVPETPTTTTTKTTSTKTSST